MEGFFAAIVVAFVTLIGQLWISGRSLSHQAKLAQQAQEETRRTKRFEYLIQLMQSLIEASGEFGSFLGKPEDYRETDHGQHELSTIIEKAIAACLASGDNELKNIALDILTPNRVKTGEYGALEDYTTRNRNGLQKAITRLAVLIETTYYSE